MQASIRLGNSNSQAGLVVERQGSSHGAMGQRESNPGGSKTARQQEAVGAVGVEGRENSRVVTQVADGVGELGKEQEHNQTGIEYRLSRLRRQQDKVVSFASSHPHVSTQPVYQTRKEPVKVKPINQLAVSHSVYTLFYMPMKQHPIP